MFENIVFGVFAYFAIDWIIGQIAPNVDQTLRTVISVLIPTAVVLWFWIFGDQPNVQVRIPGREGRVGPQLPVRRARRRKRLDLKSLQLILTPREGKKLALGRFVNPNKAQAIRPVAEIVVNDKGLVGKKLPIEFNFLDPRGATRYEVRLKPVLKYGLNRVTPASFFKTPRNLKQGVWKLRLWAGNRSWAEQTFSISTKDADHLANMVPLGGDMETNIENAEQEVEGLEGLSIDDLLE